VLVANGALPGRNEHVARLERWVRDRVSGLEPVHRQMVNTYATSVVLRRLRHRADAGEVVHSLGQDPGQRRCHLLSWLAERGQGSPTWTRACSSASSRQVAPLLWQERSHATVLLGGLLTVDNERKVERVPGLMTYSAAFAEGLAEEMARDPDIFVIGTDLVHRGGHWSQVKGLADRVGPGRIFDAPISEAAMVATGVGAAMAGMRPIVDLNFVDFAFGAMDEIANQAAKIPFMLQRPVPLIVRATSGVAHGGPQHNNSLESFFMNLPGVDVAVPAFPYDVKGLLKTALRGDGPVIYLMHKRLTGVQGSVGGPDENVPFGSARVCLQGSDCTVVSYGGSTAKALQAAEALGKEGASVEVVDLRTLAPLDVDTLLTSVRKTGRAVVVDEAPTFAGPNAEVAAIIQERAFEYLDAPVARVGPPRSCVPEGQSLLDRLLPRAEDVVAAVRRTFTAFGGASP
jgi:pyruvate/2-oxoglutarate/acetoin dehydrogenase E1 component